MAPPDARAARRAVTVVFLLNGTLFGAWASRLPAIKAGLDLGDAAFGVALGLIAVGALIAMPVSGWMSGRGGSRRTTRLALVCFCATLPLPAMAPVYALLLPAMLVLGAAGGALDVAMNAHGVAVERRHPKPILSSFHAAFSLGALAGAGSGALAAGVGLDVRWHLLAAAALWLVVGVAASRALLPADADDAGEEAGPLLALPPRALWAIGAFGFCALLAEGATADWSAVYVRESLGAPASVAALAFAAFSATMTLGRLAGDHVTARFGPVAQARLGGLLAAGGMALALGPARPATAVAGFAALGVGLSAMVPVVFRAGSEVPGIAPGMGIASVSTLGYAGFLLGPPFIGGLAELTSLRAALVLLLALGLVMAALAPRVRPARRDARLSPSPAAAR